jgi:hypothetical protein
VQHGKDALVHQTPHDGGKHATTPVWGCLSHNHDMHDTVNARRCGREEWKEESSSRYNPHCNGRYDSREDHSWSPAPPGPRAFNRAILSAPVPPRYHALMNVLKYARETNLVKGPWLVLVIE